MGGLAGLRWALGWLGWLSWLAGWLAGYLAWGLGSRDGRTDEDGLWCGIGCLSAQFQYWSLAGSQAVCWAGLAGMAWLTGWLAGWLTGWLGWLSRCPSEVSHARHSGEVGGSFRISRYLCVVCGVPLAPQDHSNCRPDVRQNTLSYQVCVFSSLLLVC